MISSNDLLMGTFVCMLGPLTLDRSAMGSTGGSMGSPMGQGSMGQGSMGQGSPGQGPSGQGPSGQGSTGQGSMGQGSTGQGYTAGQPGSAAEQCVTVAQSANVMPTSLAMGDATAIDSVRRTLDSRLSAEGASPDVSNNTLAFFDKGVAAAKEARIATESIYSGSSRGTGGGPSSSGTSSGHGHSGSSTSKPDSKQSSSSRPGAEEIRAHRALGDLYQFGRNLGATENGTAAQALSWIIAVDRFEAVNDLPTQYKALAAEPLFAVILNVPAPSGGRANAWNDYLAAAARSAGGTTPGAGAVGGGPSGGGEKANMRQVARAAEERLQVLGQQLPPSSPLRSEVDRTIADLRKMETPPSQPPTQGTQQQQQPRSTPKKPPSQQNQPKPSPQNQSPQNQKQQK
jgi:hypothetical protein